MNHEQTFRARHSHARRGEKLEANLSAMQRDAQEQARPVPERDLWTGANFQGFDTGWGFGLALSQLRVVGDSR